VTVNGILKDFLKAGDPKLKLTWCRWMNRKKKPSNKEIIE